MKSISNLGLVALALLSLVLAGCGDPAIGKLQTIKLTASSSGTGGFYDLKGEGGTLQLDATGYYSSTNTVDLTQRVTYQVTPIGLDLGGDTLSSPPATMTLNVTGLATAVQPFVCTWTNKGSDTQPSYFLTGSYAVTATYKGITSQPVYVGVASAGGDGPGGACGP